MLPPRATLSKRLARSGALMRAALVALYYEGPRAYGYQQWVWLRKRWHYLTAARERGGTHTAAAPVATASPGEGAERARELPQRAIAEQRTRRAGDLRVLFIASVENLLSKRYRVDNPRALLRAQGICAASMFDIDVARRMADALTFDVIVLQRLAATPALRRLARAARERGIALVFDADDYVFDTSVLPYVAALREAPAEKVEEHRRYVAGCQEMLHLCACFTGSTEFLAQRAREAGVRGYVLPNGLNATQIALARRARATGRPRDGMIRIGYLPGTRTHAQDFRVAVPALVRLMRQRPEVVLVVRGPLAVPAALADFGPRVERRHLVSWRRLVAATATLDIALAPLEPNNPVNEAKSALKYFEAGLVAVPVVATPTAEMRRAIADGVTGLLAADDDAWYTALHDLVADPARRAAMGRAARFDTLARYAPAVQCAEVGGVFREIARVSH